MNGRTMDKRALNIFWVVNGRYSVGNFENPRILLREFTSLSGDKKTWWVMSVNSTYATQHSAYPGQAVYEMEMQRVRDSRNNVLLERLFMPDYPADPCRWQMGWTGREYPLQTRDGKWHNILDKVQFIEIQARPQPQSNRHWGIC
jgi:hypothetical protein